MKARKGGRLWNALAQRAGKGSVQSAMLPRTFPAVSAPALSDSACLTVFTDHNTPQQPHLSIPVIPCTSHAHPCQWSTSQTANNTVPGLTRNPAAGINPGKQQPELLD
ncbi:hypothetical protein XENOCAPTIV_026598 [Xenoophorus captivus]|uniref:Uncharacterized protein n=1 Tax=Xenoophorus captivus TaxID=1517983 RepID=A0ABV0REY8_9TELE